MKHPHQASPVPTVIYPGTAGDGHEPSFSELAYRHFAHSIPWLPRLSDLQTVVHKVEGNAAVVPKVLKHPSGFAVLPVHTVASGHIDESVFSLAQLPSSTPLTILAALKMRVSFTLYGQAQIEVADAAGVLGHPRALTACNGTLTNLELPKVPVDNNATGLRLVRTDPRYKDHFALGPSAYTQLIAKRTNCEDAPAYTTFLLLHNGTDNRPMEKQSKVYKALLALEVDDIPGQLAQVLSHLAAWNISYLSSIFDSQLRGYRFLIEIECGKDGRARLERTLLLLPQVVGVAHLVTFGGMFPVLMSQ